MPTAAPNSGLAGRVAIVTGGSRGLGRAIGFGLARAGADVVITSRRIESCRETAEAIAAETGRKALPVACHVGDWGQIDELLAQTENVFGRIDILVNNAGLSPTYSSAASVSEELFDKVIAVNLKGPFRLMALVADRMGRSGGGAIVNVSSVAAVWPRGDAMPYGAAKAGLNNLTTAFAHAYGPQVRVNAVQPGAFFTDVAKHWDMEAFARHKKGIALRRGGEPDEIVGAVLYLASDASSYTTGVTIPVDGGYWQPFELAARPDA
ncbi:SDR family NAD(P)-dependent oxidoreductase [Mycobacterium sp. E796]|uniref:SDR family NAD(P)-dependent oxidoreductase n=1 Tax=Mycobacterium sp. E796 TaxID=1834151 RepID=UPI0007FE38A6|nr:SDR family oxidoreductase [Mycobacterium sp. E796]OBI44166.1 short-chain dehydrogenase [Mycobacterium sp. E796]